MDKNKISISTYNQIADIYTQQYFDDLSDTPYIDKFLNLLKPGSKILDVGSGPGQFSKYTHDKGFKLLGIDLSDEMLKVAKSKVPECDFQKMDMRQLNFNNESFDGILAAYSLIHIESAEVPDTLKEFYRVLKPGGFLQIIAQSGKPDQTVDEPFKPDSKMFINFFNKQQLNELMESAGFSIQFSQESDSQDPDSMSDRVIYLIAKK